MKKKTILSILGSVLLAGVVGVAGVVGFSNRMTDEEKTELVHSILAQLPDGTADGIFIGYSEETEEVYITSSVNAEDIYLAAENPIAYNNYAKLRETYTELNSSVKDILDDNGAGFTEVISIVNSDAIGSEPVLEIKDGKVKTDIVEESM